MGPWAMHFSETACQFHSIEGKCTCFAVLASIEPARPGQAGLNAHGGPWGTYISHPTRHGRLLVHGPAASGVNGQCVVLQYTPDTGRPMPMASAAPIGAGSPRSLFQLPLGHLVHGICRGTGEYSGIETSGPSRFPGCGCAGPCRMARPLWRAPREEATGRGRGCPGPMRTVYV